jgi:hypothetical protein
MNTRFIAKTPDPTQFNEKKDGLLVSTTREIGIHIGKELSSTLHYAHTEKLDGSFRWIIDRKDKTTKHPEESRKNTFMILGVCKIFLSNTQNANHEVTEQYIKLN